MNRNHHGAKTVKAYRTSDLLGAAAADHVGSISDEALSFTVYESEDEPGWFEIEVESLDQPLESAFLKRVKEKGEIDNWMSLHASKSSAVGSAKWWAKWAVEESLVATADVWFDDTDFVAEYQGAYYVKAENTK